MTDLEDLLTRELGVVADAEAAPRVDTLGVRRVARRERRRRATVAAAAAAVVVGLGGVLVGGTRGSDTPVAAEDLQGGASLLVPWVAADGETVHWDGRALRVPDLRSGILRGQRLLVSTQVGTRTPAWSRVLQSDGGELVLAPDEGIGAAPAVSYDGRWVAWVGPASMGSTSLQVTVLDTDTAERSVTTVEAGAAGMSVDSVDGSGRVVLDEAGSGRVLLWTPGVAPVVVTGLPDDVAGVSLAGHDLALVAEDHVSGTPPVIWRLADDGTASRVGPIAGTARDTDVAPDGSHYVTVVGDDLAFADLRAGGTSTVGPALPLPGAGTGWSQFAWESGSDVVLARQGAEGLDLVRCSTIDEGCEQVPDRVWSGFGYE